MGILADPNRGEAAQVTAYLSPRNRGSLGQPASVRTQLWYPVDTSALTSDRVYREGRAYAQAAAELEHCAGTHFDPEVVAAFRRVPPGDWEELRRRSLGDAPAAEEEEEATTGAAGRSRGRRAGAGGRPRIWAA